MVAVVVVAAEAAVAVEAAVVVVEDTRYAHTTANSGRRDGVS